VGPSRSAGCGSAGGGTAGGPVPPAAPAGTTGADRPTPARHQAIEWSDSRDRTLGGTLDVRGDAFDSNGRPLDGKGGKLGSNGGTLDRCGGTLDSRNRKLDATGDKLEATGDKLDGRAGNLDGTGDTLDAGCTLGARAAPDQRLAPDSCRGSQAAPSGQLGATRDDRGPEAAGPACLHDPESGSGGGRRCPRAGGACRHLATGTLRPPGRQGRDACRHPRDVLRSGSGEPCGPHGEHRSRGAAA
jgi:hypothetical protein